MECNKEEAARAKGIAENKMQSTDFLGARKIALKAQQLYPDLENIIQLLTVCEVHCSAATKVNGLEDWYGILQLEPTADELSIKKQYRKLALLLHPDKNKFAGAESAFKLIGEAHRTLSDPTKRSGYDSRRTHFKVAGAPVISNAFSGVQQQQATACSTFWTFCPFCKIRYQYYRQIMNRPIRCQTCLRTFVAYDLNVNVPVNTNSGASSKQPGVTQQNGFPTQGTFKTKANQCRGASFSKGFQGNTRGRTGNNKAAEEKQVHDDRKKNGVRFEEVKLSKDEKPEAVKPSTYGKQKRSREHVVHGSKDKPSGAGGSDSDIEVVTEQSNGFARRSADTAGNEKRRRSNREKPNVQYADGPSEDDKIGRQTKRSGNFKPSHPSGKHDAVHHATDVNGTKIHKEQNSGAEKQIPPQNVTESENSRSHVASGENTSEIRSNLKKDTDSAQTDSGLMYPESEFYDFHLDRDESSFKEGQIWALYDDQDGMPRFYAKIIKVSSLGSKVRYTWLEFFPEGQTAKDWHNANFPVACGTFRFGKTETTTEIAVFSHLMTWEKGTGKNTFVIKPRKGEVWALYKSWDVNWISSPENHQTYEYEIVEVLSDVDDADISVVPLVKVEGFVSVFTRAVSEDATWIPVGELVRFSHLVPSHEITASEIERIPEGSYELDPGSLPGDFEKTFTSVTLDVKKVKSEDPSVRVENCQKDASETEHQKSYPQPSASESSEENEEFHDFESDKTLDKFKCGQVWALYSDFDTFPKYYALITATPHSSSEVHVTWLDSCPESEEERKWFDKEVPLSTGKFKLSSGKDSREVYDTLQAFSHPVDTQDTGRKNQFYVYPQAGQIWALYRNWSANWEVSDVTSCEYDIAEIQSINDLKVKVMLLTKVEGYHTVYMPEREHGMPVMLEVQRTEMLRLSHQIPAYRLKGEKSGTLHGYWELDPDSLPE